MTDKITFNLLPHGEIAVQQTGFCRASVEASKQATC